MEVRKQFGLRSTALLGIPLMAMLLLAWGQISAPAASAAGLGPEMVASVSGPGVDCSDGECEIDLGGEFTYSVEIAEAPAEGYIFVQTFVDFGENITNVERANIADEFLWPDVGAEEVIIRGTLNVGELTHGGISGLIPPLPASDYTGPLLELDFVCSDEYSRTAIRLLPGRAQAVAEDTNRTSGTLFAFESGTTRVDVPVKTNPVVVHCGEAPPPSVAPPVVSLPDTGTYVPSSNSGLGASGWVAIVALLAISATGISTFGLREFAGRRGQ